MFAGWAPPGILIFEAFFSNNTNFIIYIIIFAIPLFFEGVLIFILYKKFLAEKVWEKKFFYSYISVLFSLSLLPICYINAGERSGAFSVIKVYISFLRRIWNF